MKATIIAALLLLGVYSAPWERALAAGETPAAEALPPADPASVDRGRTFVQARCARCHATGPADVSTLPAAPPLRRLHRRYPVESLEEAFGEGIVTAHPGMPRFALEEDEIRDLIAYLHSIED